ncbi:hypothetical protein CL620_04900 [archaeon]|nr:hypothetical protein [archaeon]
MCNQGGDVVLAFLWHDRPLDNGWGPRLARQVAVYVHEVAPSARVAAVFYDEKNQNQIYWAE